MKRIELWDSFNNVLISKHNSLMAAVRKQRDHLKRVKKANGSNSYIVYAFKDGCGQPINRDLLVEAMCQYDKETIEKDL